MNLYWGDNLEHLQFEDDNSIDAVVTDPPYGLSFMGKKWDYDVPSVDLWREVIRVLKPGGHLLSFGGTRTYHRMVVNIEDAGFEIRDQIMWIYGSGFPKSLDISKALDKAAGAGREVVGTKRVGMASNEHLQNNSRLTGQEIDKHLPITVPTTPDAKRWQGFGTALKPANEPIVLARKPIEKGLTISQNVLKWGTGALNIDGSRIAGAIPQVPQPKLRGGKDLHYGSSDGRNGEMSRAEGRWPANVIFDEDAAEMLDAQSGNCKSRGEYKSFKETAKGIFQGGNPKEPNKYANEQGGASRFFYVAKTSKRERNAGLEGMKLRASPKFDGGDFERGNGNNAKDQKAQNFHPTVKPIKLMEYLIKLITPPNGVVLDPFMGSGSTGCAATNLKFRFIGIELEKEYFEIAKRRIAHHQKGKSA